jgi:hypothetical protein
MEDKQPYGYHDTFGLFSISQNYPNFFYVENILTQADLLICWNVYYLWVSLQFLGDIYLFSNGTITNKKAQV